MPLGFKRKKKDDFHKQDKMDSLVKTVRRLLPLAHALPGGHIKVQQQFLQSMEEQIEKWTGFGHSADEIIVKIMANEEFMKLWEEIGLDKQHIIVLARGASARKTLQEGG